MNNATQFLPDWASPPGETIADILEERGITTKQFSRTTSLPLATIAGLISGVIEIDVRIATILSNSLGASVDFWQQRETNFREAINRLEIQAQDEATVEWCRSLPFADMATFGWISSTRKPKERVSRCLQFFGVGNFNSWCNEYQKVEEGIAFRKSNSFEGNPTAVAVWIRQGQIEAAKITCNEYDPSSLESLLPELRTLTKQSDPQKFIPAIRAKCASCGVAVVVLRAPKGCTASGATFFIGDQPVLMLSGRYLSDDHFWFTFFHEIGHILLHRNRRIFVEFESGGGDSVEEKEANQFAQDVIIPECFREEFLRLGRDTRAVLKFARKIGVSAGLVVGQLQFHERLQNTYLNKAKKRYCWNGSALERRLPN